jgi:PncC family amidohydrolase
MLPAALTEPAHAIAERLTARGETIAVAESASGGLISAALLAVPGASAYYAGGVVIYTLVGASATLSPDDPLPDDTRGASEPFATWLAAKAAAHLDAHWSIGETGAAGPAGNRYGDPAGHAWVAVRGPDGRTRTRNVLTGLADRAQNMELFAAGALGLLLEALS